MLTNDGSLVNADQSQLLAEVLSNIDAYQPAPEVDSALFEQLKAELTKQLIGRGEERIATAAPSGSANSVRDLMLTVHEDESATLSWRYLNTGDYDQNGEVNVSDLTPIAVNFLAQSPTPAGTWMQILEQTTSGYASLFDADSAVSAVDGDRNGEINVSDVTPIGQNFGARLAGYYIFASNNGADYPAAGAPTSIVPLGTIMLADALGKRGTDRLHFAFELASAPAGTCYWVQPFHDSAQGPASAYTGNGWDTPPAGQISLQGITPASAEPGQPVLLSFNCASDTELDGVELSINEDISFTLAPDQLPVANGQVTFLAPALPPGVITIAAEKAGAPVGQVNLTILAATPEVTEEEFAATIDALPADATLVVSSMFASMAEGGVEIDTEVLASDMAALENLFSALREIISEGLAELSMDERLAFIAFLENSGSLPILEYIGFQAEQMRAKQGSSTSIWNWEYLGLDVLSAMVSNSGPLVDIGGVYASLQSVGTGLLPYAAIRVFLIVLDAVIDSYLATDLHGIKLYSQRYCIPLDDPLDAQPYGVFYSEKQKIAGTIEGVINLVLAVKGVGAAAKETVTQAVKDELGDKGIELGAKLVNASVSAVEDSESPYYGHVGPYELPLDVYLYESNSFRNVLDKVGWRVDFKAYEQSTPNFATTEDHTLPNVAWNRPAEANYTWTRSEDWISFSQAGKYLLTLNAFRYDTSYELFIYSFATGTPVAGVFDFQAGFAPTTWTTATPITADIVDFSIASYIVNAGGRPAIAGSVKETGQLFYLAAQDARGLTWSPPVFFNMSGTCFVTDLTIVNGVPAIAYYGQRTGPEYYTGIILAADTAGTLWNEPVEIDSSTDPNHKTSIFSLGNHKGRPAMVLHWRSLNSYFMEALNASGTAWNDPIALGGGRVHSHMFEVQGRCTFLLYERLNDNFIYYRSLEENEESDFVTSFETQIINNNVSIPSTTGFGFGLSDGNPAYAYQRSGQDSVLETYYCEALDPLGYNWGEPELLSVSADAFHPRLGYDDQVTYVLYPETYDDNLTHTTIRSKSSLGWGLPELVCSPTKIIAIDGRATILKSTYYGIYIATSP